MQSSAKKKTLGMIGCRTFMVFLTICHLAAGRGRYVFFCINKNGMPLKGRHPVFVSDRFRYEMESVHSLASVAVVTIVAAMTLWSSSKGVTWIHNWGQHNWSRVKTPFYIMRGFFTNPNYVSLGSQTVHPCTTALDHFKNKAEPNETVPLPESRAQPIGK
jgi:hypothetical protein